jgi:CBS domain-containing protein
MAVKDVMTRRAETTGPEETIERAAERMRDFNIGILPVCHHDRLIGVVTDRDITVRATAAGRGPGRTTVREVMTHQVFTCFEDDDLAGAAALMEQRAVRRLLVLDRDMRLVGVLSVDDVARAVGQARLAGEIVEQAAEPRMPEPPPP